MKYSIKLKIIAVKNATTDEPKKIEFYSKEHDNLIYCFEEILSVLGIKTDSPLRPEIYNYKLRQAYDKSELLCDEIAEIIKIKCSLDYCNVFYSNKIKIE